jgi:hypothetical protein
MVIGEIPSPPWVTIFEAELLEEWNETLGGSGLAIEQASEAFEEFMKTELSPGRSLKDDLEDQQRWAAVRRNCRAEAERIVSGGRSDE